MAVMKTCLDIMQLRFENSSIEPTATIRTTLVELMRSPVSSLSELTASQIFVCENFYLNYTVYFLTIIL
jgi:hypothetical protein